MSQKKCKRCGAYYEYSVTSNGYSEKYCTFSCESYDRIDELKLTVEEKVNSLSQLKDNISALVNHLQIAKNNGSVDVSIQLIVDELQKLTSVS